MSFGFGFGDFVTLIQLVEDVRDQFVEAPKEYKALADVWVLTALVDINAALTPLV